MIRYKGYEHTHTNPEKSETTARRQAKNADRTLIFAKEKPKPNTFVFDLGFDCGGRLAFLYTPRLF